jgi:hypothetical protein
MRLSAEAWFLWLSGLGLLIYLTLVLYRRKLLTEFPIFSFYTVYHLVYGIIEFSFRLLRADPLTIFIAFWLREVIDIVIILAVVYELFSKVLEPYPGLQKVGSRLYLYGAAVAIPIALWMAISYHYFEVLDDGLRNMVRSLHFVEISLIFALFVFCRVFGLAWRHYVFGIALGFGIKSSMQTVAESLSLQSRYPGSLISGLLSAFAYLTGLVLWSYFFSTQEKTVPVEEVGRSPYLARWNTALEELLAART